MKKSFKVFLLSMIFLFGSRCFSQVIVDDPYEVATWSQFHSAAISYTFDDNCANQLAVAVPMFNEFSYTLTLFTVTNWSPNWTGLQNAASQGHEIASHTVSHASLGGLTDAQQLTELQNSQDIINSHITGQKCATIAYPNCVTGNSSIVRQYYFAARGCQGFVEGKTPGNFMNISSIVCGSNGLNTTAALTTKADDAARLKGWCVYLIHAIDGDNGYSPISSTIIRESLNYLQSNQDKFWVASFGTVAKYILERNSLNILNRATWADSVSVQVTDTLDNSIFNCPITIRRPLPQGWTSCTVVQNGNTIQSQIVQIDTVKYIVFDVIPDNGIITFIKTTTNGIGHMGDNSPSSPCTLLQNYPNPFNPSTTISFSIASPSFGTLKVFDLMGREVACLVSEQLSAGNYTRQWDAKEQPSGIYFYRLSVVPIDQPSRANGNARNKSARPYTETKKVVLMK